MSVWCGREKALSGPNPHWCLRLELVYQGILKHPIAQNSHFSFITFLLLLQILALLKHFQDENTDCKKWYILVNEALAWYFTSEVFWYSDKQYAI